MALVGVEGTAVAPGLGLECTDGVLEVGGRRVVAAVSVVAVAVLFARACPRTRGLGGAEGDGRPLEDVGRVAVAETFLFASPGVCCEVVCRTDGALPNGLDEGAVSVAVGLLRLVVVAPGLPEKMPDKGLPEAVVAVDVAAVAAALLAALLRAAADADGAVVVVADRVRGLTWGSRLGDTVLPVPLVASPSFWVDWVREVVG